MRIITRNTWRAERLARTPAFVQMKERTHFIVHHSAGPADQPVANIQHHHIHNRGFRDIGYNFLVRGTTGEVYEGRGWNQEGAHTIGNNRTGIGVCVIGNDQLSPDAKESLRQLYHDACQFAGHTLTVTGHRDHDQTLCPGRKTYAWLRSGALSLDALPLLKLRLPRTTGAAVRLLQQHIGAPVDGVFGPVTEEAVRDWQSDHHLEPDGVVGPLTWAALGVTHL